MPPIDPPATENKCFDAEVVEQHGLRAYHVANGDDGKFQAPRLTSRRISRSRPGGAHAAADHVRADHEIAFGVDRLAGTDQGFPPAAFAGDRVLARHVLIAGERMANQHRVGALGVERAVSLVGDLERAKRNAGIEFQRFVSPEIGNSGVARMVRLARHIRFTRARQIGLDHVASRSQHRAQIVNASPGPGPLYRRRVTFNLPDYCQRFL